MKIAKPQDQKIAWMPHEGPQTLALSRNEYEILYGGARGGGKTDAGIAWLTRWIGNPNFRGLVIRRNSDDLSDWIDRATMLYFHLGGKAVGNPAIFKFPSGARIKTGHLKDDNAYTKYQGHEYHKMVIEELTQIPSEESYLKLISACRSTIQELKPQVFSTTNPGGIGHGWVKERFGITGAPKNAVMTTDEFTERTRVFIPGRIEDNPTLFDNDPGYVAFLEGLPTDLRRAWRDGDWDIFAGQYFAEWRPEKHVINPYEVPNSYRKFRCIDHGRAAPTACLWGAIDYDGRIIWYREYYMAGIDADLNAQKIKELSLDEEYWFTVLDSACFSNTGTGETIAEIYMRNGVFAAPSPKNRLAGWALFHEYLRDQEDKLPKMTFFKNCKHSIESIPTLIHDEKKPEDLDSNGEDHAADAISYGLQFMHEGKTAKPKSPTEQKFDEYKRKKRLNPNNINQFYANRK